MQISDVYQPELLTRRARDPLPIVAREMADHQVGVLAVLDARRVLGISSLLHRRRPRGR